mmetsp:Transcript_9017/g.12835  ORF Transcript_9017/g.12835 Transcript_9017/m.12835 type:complete len:499 (+) Transcript_9017:190-1686(+)|eukprot:CAMPEP_0184864916 /NCGR_PEP_ID=MMETSP0580-20130426/16318_1 /TAXON_ID=1118495 /ORGANISM="Dactyliosolen fragilissimus" /LENGTH=498 /DNA_ID=CAMNT_0027363869 /DNA_START=153 /DNA_END=1649 /DNA_ORIENTATION=-
MRCHQLAAAYIRQNRTKLSSREKEWQRLRTLPHGWQLFDDNTITGSRGTKYNTRQDSFFTTTINATSGTCTKTIRTTTTTLSKSGGGTSHTTRTGIIPNRSTPQLSVNRSKFHPMVSFSTSSSDIPNAKNHNSTTNNNNSNNNNETVNQNKNTSSLHDTVNRLQSEDTTSSSSNSSSTSSSSSNTNEQTDQFIDKMFGIAESFSSGLSNTWQELIQSSQPKEVNKKLADIHKSKPGSVDQDDNEAADKYDGTTAIMIIDENENIGAFERIQKRLSEAPIIQGIMNQAEQVYEKSGAKKVREKIDHASEDAREAWETSQNPWVYRASSVYETLTAESEHAMAERELRELDPYFSIEHWKNDVIAVTVPKFMNLFLEGRIKELKPMLGESVYNRLAAEARTRKKEGVYVDTNVLQIFNSDILSINPDTVNKGSPIIVIHFMCQQINCVRKKKTHEIVEGGEDDIKAYSYLVGFQREYDEKKGELNWKIVDFMLNGAIAYL